MQKRVETRESVFFSAVERDRFANEQSDPGLANQWTALRTRVLERASQRGLSGSGVTTKWWFHVAEFLTDAALVYAAEHDTVGLWLRSAALDAVRELRELGANAYVRVSVPHMQRFSFLLGVKPGSHKTLFEDIKGLCAAEIRSIDWSEPISVDACMCTSG